MRKREKIWKIDTYKNPNKSVERDRKKITNEIEKFRKRKVGESGGGLKEKDKMVVKMTKLQGLDERKVEGNTFFFYRV